MKSKFDDITEDSTGHLWSQVCKSCVQTHNFSENLLDDAGSGICGVIGCSNESDYYIDFEEENNHE